MGGILIMSKKLRIVSGLLAALLLFSAAGCGKEGTESSDASSETTAPSDVSVSDNSTVSGGSVRHNGLFGRV